MPSRAPPSPPVRVVLPRADYTIVEDSRDVIGLSGSGSKDIVADSALRTLI